MKRVISFVMVFIIILGVVSIASAECDHDFSEWLLSGIYYVQGEMFPIRCYKLVSVYRRECSMCHLVQNMYYYEQLDHQFIPKSDGTGEYCVRCHTESVFAK